MTKRVLIVTNAFPPAMLADMQRARMLAYDLPKFGWEVEVLAPSLAFQRSLWIEPESRCLLPDGVAVHEAQPCGDRIFRWLKMRSLGWRAAWPLYRMGCRVLGARKFDLVYITTAQFNLFCLGPLWHRKFGVPYVLDYHDPWFRDTYEYVTTRHGLKFRLSMALAKPMERFALRRAAGLVAVSPMYLDQLQRRYPRFACVAGGRRTAIPFGATLRDLEAAQKVSGDSPAAPVGAGAPASANLEVIYVGAGGSIMAKSFRRIAAALARLRGVEPGLVNRVRLRLFGTDSGWQPGNPKLMETIAGECGIGDLVEEQPVRVGYLRALEFAIRSRGLLILGVDDPPYMPSKLFTYALTGRPLLASLHARSQANRYFQEMPRLGHLIHFDGDAADVAREDAEVLAFIRELAAGARVERAAEIEPYLSPAAARRHAEFFDQCLVKARTTDH